VKREEQQKEELRRRDTYLGANAERRSAGVR